ncbi:Membrane protein YdfJ [Clostridium liquoris]|jgi:hypothetical protein|uniref:Membrane protein YdfJ n=1 Tax=Clostridium liquoris TaxID=1289519 RepID=A0A2T0B696_9CLOT|nr:MMPL family transporter [Clostridium liquoris]PRR79410.1 Membrane protein YdfJ [Clostridium liquoris]
MKKFGKLIAEKRVLVLIISVLLLIPSFWGMAKTKVNYDMLEYLPKNLDSMKGQEILDKKFSNAANSMLIIENMESKDVLKLKDNISEISGVEKVIWISDMLDTSIPKEILPEEIKDSFYSKNSTMLIIRYTDSASSEKTQKAIGEIRNITDKQCFLSGASAIVKDTKDLSDKETPFYILIAVILSIIVLALTMESTIIPFIFLISMGFAIMYNMGTNIFLGQVSYVTKSIAAVLQLGVTMDYSIFLLHRYEEEKLKFNDRNEAMGEAIANTITSISGSSLTTIAGFLALCSMQLSLGKDIGIVMAKGVLLGVISTVTILPALILMFDKYIYKFKHKTVLPDFSKTASLVSKKYKVFIAIFLLAFIPAIFGNNHLKVYYNLDKSLPENLPSIIATNKLKEDYNMTTTHFALVNDDVPPYKRTEMIKKIEEVDGVDKVLGYDKFVGAAIPESFVPNDIKDLFKKGGYNLILVNSKYKSATNEENNQIDEIESIVKSYDKNAMLTGEGVLTKDLVQLADKDFKSSNAISILAIFAIIFAVFQSISIPILLVASIELAILINMSVSFYMGTTVPFIASIVIGCIQLGATVDYAILLTSRFKEELQNGLNKFDAMEKAVKESGKSIATSALTFFGATFGVGMISNLSIIKTLCTMMARGALISMVVIIFILPSILLVCEKLIAVTSRNWRKDSGFKIDKKTAV